MVLLFSILACLLHVAVVIDAEVVVVWSCAHACSFSSFVGRRQEIDESGQAAVVISLLFRCMWSVD